MSKWPVLDNDDDFEDQRTFEESLADAFMNGMYADSEEDAREHAFDPFDWDA